MTNQQTAMLSGYMRCHDCGKLINYKNGEHAGNTECPRCSSPIHYRTPQSMSRTWALLIAAIVLFIPANILPIMEVTFLGSVAPSTIMDGIIYFFQHGSFGIGLVIFTASVLVPLFKIVGMIIILLSIHFRWEHWLKHKTIMARFIHFIGRWSMLDIFVIALLCVLVNFSSLSSITAAPAATYFCMVVVLTMLAANTLDARLLWDSQNISNDRDF